jgi:hypothetical protein
MMYALDLFDRYRSGKTALMPDEYFLDSATLGPTQVLSISRRDGSLWAKVLDHRGEKHILLVHAHHRIKKGLDDPGPCAPHNFKKNRRF